MSMSVEKAQGDELIQQRAVEGDLSGRIPSLQVHGGIQMRLLRPQGNAQAVAASHFVAEEEQQPILMRHLLLPGEHEPLGQAVQQGRELEPAQHGFQIGTDHFGSHWGSSPFSEDRSRKVSERAYWLAGRKKRAGKRAGDAVADGVVACSSMR